MSKISKIQKNRVIFFFAAFCSIALIIALPIIGFYYYNQNLAKEILSKHNQNLEIHNQAFFISQKNYQELITLTEEISKELSEVQNLSQESEVLKGKSVKVKDQKTKIETSSLEIEELQKELDFKQIRETEKLNELVKNSLFKYQEFNFIIVNYLDYYSCQLENLSLRSSLEFSLVEIKIKVRTSQNQAELAQNFRILGEEKLKIADTFENYKNCFNDDINDIKPEKLEDLLKDLKTENQNLSKNLENLSKTKSDTPEPEMQKLLDESQELQVKTDELTGDLKEALKEVLFNFDKKIETTEDELQIINEEIEKESNFLKEKAK